MALDLDKYNDRVKEWGRDTINRMAAQASAMAVVHRSDSPSKGSSIRKLKDKYRMKDGGVDQVSIKFPRSLIWTHKGAGKGRAGATGSKWTDKYGQTKTTKEASKGKMATLGRKAKPFFDRTLDGPNGVEQLADIVAEETGDVLINNMFIK
jgi:hypothetical protein